MLTCFFAMNHNCTDSNRPLRRPIQGHRKERQSHENPDKPAHLDSEPETGTEKQH